MKITFTAEPIATLTLIRHGWRPGSRFRLLRQGNLITLTLVTDNDEWDTLCADSQHGYDLGADWVRQNGELVIGGDWLSEFDLTRPKQIKATAAPGKIVITQREQGYFSA
ncbi:hypothetical protein [Serratia odorifera]|jgi:hypothetical protein|uniref:Toxin SymE-like domain-containing protein n=2 Tax=Serratia odorifera TaxID=618 RepID=D4E6R7_SEROD|nr:hypothetical protein [Serratia odorifera]EFE94633.1 hypothetical protein HMPREF0758_3867 [Serratia odorifera DSM 4582]MBJ2065018.1 hypothetical protein [Serratia odorifera]PNK89326.1 hypothetical protein CEQ31_006245 [Serratia odorifera]RII70428.1 hypothetical protein DX901_20055 [Serratia odorifera]VDZ63626.1 Uncharacterised protein [Serratia odorifera]